MKLPTPLLPTFRSLRAFSLLLCFLLTACASLSQPADVLRMAFTSPSQRYLQEGDRLSAAGRTPEAILAYAKAVQLDSQNITALVKLSSGYANEGRRRLAERYLLRAQALKPTDNGVQQALAKLKSTVPQTAPLHLIRAISNLQGVPTGMDCTVDHIYVALEDGEVVAFDTDGTALWHTNLPAAATSAPFVAGDLLLIGAQDGSVYAVSTSDGSIHWHAATHDSIYATPEVTGKLVLIASSDNSLYAFSLIDGSLQWQFSTQAPLHASPLVFDNIAYFGSADTHLYAVDAISGKPVWPHGIPTQGAIEDQPLISNGRIFFGSGDGRIYALDPATGGEYWRYSTPDSVFASPIESNGTIYIASSGQVISALDALTGQPLWEQDTQTPLRQSPVIAGNMILYVAESDPNLYAVNLTNGAPLWKMDTGDWIASPPILAGNMLLLAGKDGAILEYELNP